MFGTDASRPLAAWLGAAALCWTAVPPANADWLVTRDGARVETDGPWEVRGRQVVFTLPNGTLSALRLDEVDLEASDKATAASLAEEAPPPAPERRPVLVLTNDDLPRRARSAAPSEEGAETPAEEGDAPADDGEPPRPASTVAVTSWNAQPSADVSGLELVGVVRNTGSGIAANVTVSVTVVDPEGRTLLETSAFLRSDAIAPGRSTTFRALLPGIVQLRADPIFELQAVEVAGTPATSEEDPVETQEEDEGDE